MSNRQIEVEAFESRASVETSADFDCPTCGRKQPNPNIAACPRCGTDLTASLLVRTAARERLGQGRKALPSHPADAANLLESSWNLLPAPETAQALACAMLLQRRYPQALRWHARAQNL